jgi:hypothetical protein
MASRRTPCSRRAPGPRRAPCSRRAPGPRRAPGSRRAPGELASAFPLCLLRRHLPSRMPFRAPFRRRWPVVRARSTTFWLGGRACRGRARTMLWPTPSRSCVGAMGRARTQWRWRWRGLRRTRRRAPRRSSSCRSAGFWLWGLERRRTRAREGR